jgi:hypothetical protein
VERFCTDFIPRQKVEAMPAVCLLRPLLKPRSEGGLVPVGSGAMFTYKNPNGKGTLNYIPLFNTSLLPHTGVYTLNHRQVHSADNVIDIEMEKPNQLWVGIQTNSELNNMKGLSMLIKGTNGITPEHIFVATANQELDFSTMHEMENIEMAEPFDAQQSSDTFFSLIENWKENLLNIDNASLIYITDDIVDRDMFKPRAYPREFPHWLESSVLDGFSADTIWLRLVFPEGFAVSADCRVMLNVLPVTNIDVETLKKSVVAKTGSWVYYVVSYDTADIVNDIKAALK